MSLLVKNLTTIAQNLGKSLLQDNALFKSNAAILVSLFQVASRSYVTTNNAKKTVGTSEENYTKREAAKTVFREWGGFTLSFGLLKAVEIGLENATNLVFNARMMHESTGPLKALSQAAKALTGQLTEPIEKLPLALSGKTWFHGPQLRAKPFFTWVANTFAKKRVAALEKAAIHKVPELGFEVFQNWMPALVGYAIALPLSGWALERLSLIRGKQIVDFLSGVQPVSERFQSEPGYFDGATTLAAQPLTRVPRGQVATMKDPLRGHARTPQPLPQFQTSPILSEGLTYSKAYSAQPSFGQRSQITSVPSLTFRPPSL